MTKSAKVFFGKYRLLTSALLVLSLLAILMVTLVSLGGAVPRPGLTLVSGPDATTGANGTITSPQMNNKGDIVFVSNASNLPGANGFDQIYLWQHGAITLVSSPDGVTGGTGASSVPQINDNGSIVFVAASAANNLVSGYTVTGTSQIYLWKNGTLTLVSKSNTGTSFNNNSAAEPIINNQDVVVFRSNATNMGASGWQLYAWENGTRTLVSSPDGSTPGSGGGSIAATGQLNDDGTLVFATQYNNLVPGVTGTASQIYTWNKNTGPVLISSPDGTTAGNGASVTPQINENGSVLFASRATNIGPNYTGIVNQLYLWKNGTITLVSSTNGTTGGNRVSENARLNDSDAVVFQSSSAGFPGGNSTTSQIYLWEAGTGLTLISSPDGTAAGNAASATPNITNDGTVVFSSAASNLLAGVGAGQVYTWKNGELKLISSPTDGSGGNGSSSTALINDNGTVAFISSASDLVSGYSGSGDQIYRWESPPTITEVIPPLGLIGGGEQVTIKGTGLIPSSTDYLSNGLIVLYDGRDNTGTGDADHSGTATTWKDLSGSGHDATVVGSLNSNWTNNSFKTKGLNYLVSSNFGNQTLLTVQVAIDIPTDFTAAGSSVSFNGDATHLSSRGLWQSSLPPSVYNPMPYVWWGNNPPANYNLTGLYRSPGLQVLTLVYDADAGTVKLKINDGAFSTVSVPSSNMGDLYNLLLGRLTNAAISDYEYYSVRVYDRELSAAEIKENYQTDVARFFTTPTVTFGGQAATNVVVVDANTIICTTPPHAIGPVDVTVTLPYGSPLTLSDGFLYYKSDPIQYAEESCDTCHYGNVHKEHASHASVETKSMPCTSCHEDNYNETLATEVIKWSSTRSAGAFPQVASEQSCGVGNDDCHSTSAISAGKVWHGLGPAKVSADHAISSSASASCAGTTPNSCHSKGSVESYFWFGDMDIASAHADYAKAAEEGRTQATLAEISNGIKDNPDGCGICHTRTVDNEALLKSGTVTAVSFVDFSCDTCHIAANGSYSTHPECSVASALLASADPASTTDPLNASLSLDELFEILSPELQADLNGTDTTPALSPATTTEPSTTLPPSATPASSALSGETVLDALK